MSTKTVLHFTGMFSTKYGGLEHYLYELARLCNQQGYRTVLQYEAMPESTAFLRDLEAIGVDVVSSSTGTTLTSSAKSVFSLIYSLRPEIVMVHFGNRYVRFLAPVLAQVLGVRKKISMVHSLHQLRKNSPRRFALNRYDYVLGVSDGVVENLLHAGVKPNITATHYLGLFGCYEATSQLRTKIRQEFNVTKQDTVLACIAFDVPVKGLDILLKAFSQVSQKYPGLHLLIVGVDPDQSTLPELAAQLSIDSCVHWAGIRDNGWQVLNAADIYIQPSRSEGLGLAIVEAMALKLPVVATRVGGIPEAVIDGETGYLADTATVGDLTDALDKMLADPTRWQHMGEAGYNRYHHLFKGENSVLRLTEKYLEL